MPRHDENTNIEFTYDELARINFARVLVSAGDFHLTYAQFIHDLTMQGVDEIIGERTNVTVMQRRERWRR